MSGIGVAVLLVFGLVGFLGTHCDAVNECLSNPCVNGGSCSESNGYFSCFCPTGFSGFRCENNDFPCFGANICQNGGNCTTATGTPMCVCPSGYTGVYCGTAPNPCSSNPCQNTGTCSNVGASFTCTCAAGFTGDRCERPLVVCPYNPCQNNAACDYSTGTSNCICPPGFSGDFCQLAFVVCPYNPCQNNAACDYSTGTTNCICPPGFSGDFCQLGGNVCSSNPCRNGGTCIPNNGGYTCQCTAGYTGSTCATTIIRCDYSPCQNNAVCDISSGAVNCICAAGFSGDFCQTITVSSVCAPNPCANGGTCTPVSGGFTCQCLPAYSGQRCENAIIPQGEVRLTGGNQAWEGRLEIYDGNTWKTVCNAGWSINDARVACRQLGYSGVTNQLASFGAGLGTQQIWMRDTNCIGSESRLVYCNSVAAPSFCGHINDVGLTCSSMSSVCDSNPCGNGGTCNDMVSYFTCTCPPTHTGNRCETAIAQQGEVRLTGGNQAWEGRLEIYDGNTWKTVCNAGWNINDARVACRQLGYSGVTNQLASFGAGLGTQQIWMRDTNCIGSESRLVYCNSVAAPSFCGHSNDVGLTCSSMSSVCDSNPCGNGGTCNDMVSYFTCTCPPTHTGNRCEIAITQQGEVRLTGGNQAWEGRLEIYDGNTWKTVCNAGWNINDARVACRQLGYSGVTNQLASFGAGLGTQQIWMRDTNCIGSESRLEYCNSVAAPSFCGHSNDVGLTCSGPSPCNSNPCINGGICSEDGSTFECSCPPQYTGRFCQEPNECASNPCQNRGICNDGNGDFTCSCQSGFAGPLCETMIEPCVFNLCQNGGICNVLNGVYNCICPNGYSGERCESVPPVCAFNPCRNSGTCSVDNFTGNYTCACIPGFSGPNCQTNVDDCEMEPCRNGGTCTDGINSYSCNCRSGFAGLTCRDVDVCASGPCQNGGSCTSPGGSVVCSCLSGYSGSRCEIMDTMCASNPCENNGTCNDLNAGTAYSCTCLPGFYGPRCQETSSRCSSGPCYNGGSCSDNGFYYTCSCPAGFFGNRCETFVGNDQCASYPCQNGGTCNDFGSNYICSCRSGFNGPRCENYLTPGEGSIRLVGGSSNREGRVEVLVNGQWGTVCSNGWTDQDAVIVCRQLGFFGFASTAYTNGRYGAGSQVSRIWLDNVACDGSEFRLMDCQADQDGVNFCNHNQDAGVSCG